MSPACVVTVWLFKWRPVPNITSFWVRALESTGCNPTHLPAAVHSDSYCFSVSANTMLFSCYSKPSSATPVATGSLSPANLELFLFVQHKCPLPLLQENYIAWNDFHFCQPNISFSSLQPEGMLCNVNLKSPDQRRRLKWLINQRRKIQRYCLLKVQTSSPSLTYKQRADTLSLVLGDQRGLVRCSAQETTP